MPASGADPSPAACHAGRWIGNRGNAKYHLRYLADYVAYYEAVAAAIRGEAPSPVPLADSLLVMRILDLALQSAKEGKRLEI